MGATLLFLQKLLKTQLFREVYIPLQFLSIVLHSSLVVALVLGSLGYFIYKGLNWWLDCVSHCVSLNKSIF